MEGISDFIDLLYKVPTMFRIPFYMVPLAMLACAVIFAARIYKVKGRGYWLPMLMTTVLLVSFFCQAQFTEDYLVAFERGKDCRKSSSKHYNVIRPLWVPTVYKQYDIGGAYFQRYDCSTFENTMKQVSPFGTGISGFILLMLSMVTSFSFFSVTAFAALHIIEIAKPFFASIKAKN